MILDATCVPVNIRYPQYISLLNEAREMLEVIIYRFCKAYELKLPRRYVRAARKDCLKFVKAKKYIIKYVIHCAGSSAMWPMI